MSAPVPRPLAAPGVVTIDPKERTLAVRPAPDARAYAKAVWLEGVLAQPSTAAARYVSRAPDVWASGAGADKIAYGLRAGGELKFQFRRGDPVYRKLVSTPGLRATFVVDRGSSRVPRAQDVRPGVRTVCPVRTPRRGKARLTETNWPLLRWPY